MKLIQPLRMLCDQEQCCCKCRLKLIERSASKFHRFKLCTICHRANAFSHKTPSRKHNVSQRVITQNAVVPTRVTLPLRCYTTCRRANIIKDNSRTLVMACLSKLNMHFNNRPYLTNAPSRNNHITYWQ